MNTGTVFIVFKFEVAAVMRDIECEFLEKIYFMPTGFWNIKVYLLYTFQSVTKEFLNWRWNTR